jgi:hypothetical protein
MSTSHFENYPLNDLFHHYYRYYTGVCYCTLFVPFKIFKLMGNYNVVLMIYYSIFLNNILIIVIIVVFYKIIENLSYYCTY